MKTINWGILGTGKIAHKFATDVLTVSNSQVYAAGSRSLESATDFIKKFNGHKAYGSYEALAQDPDVDIIYIATPHVRHCEDTILCLENGKHVLCEKPFAMNAQQVEQMIASAKKNDKFLMEALWTRMMPFFLFIEEEIKSGKYGKIQSITADFCFPAPFDPDGRLFNKALGGGALLDVGIYPVFFALALMGEPSEILAKAKIGKTGVDEFTEMTFTYADGAKAHLNGGVTQQSPTVATIILENGMIYVPTRFHHSDTVTTVLDGIKVDHDFSHGARGYNYEIAHAADCIRNGKTESYLMTHDLSRLIIKTLDTVREKIDLHY